MYHLQGAHAETRDGIAGTRFAVWAPNAEEVSVLCDANGWTPGSDKLHGSDSGVWSGFIAGMGHGAGYKYGIKTRDGALLEKSDPVAFATEHPPKTASIVYDLSGYAWSDGDWLKRRETTNWLEQPIAVYEVHLGSWKRPTDGRQYFSYRELAKMLVDYAHEMGYTHLQLMPITEFPFDGSWGYQATGYFAPTSRFGSPHDFMEFVDYCHQSGIGILIDWVPAHFPTDAHSLGRFDGTALYEHEDPRQGFHPDWGTLIFNFGRGEVCDFLLSSARFWLEQYHVDGIRVDAVASMLYLDYSREDGEWIPNKDGGRENLEAIEFLKQMNVDLHGKFPGVLTIAEESTSWGGVSHPVYAGGLGFSMKWDMGWMNDTLRYMQNEPIHRSHHQGELSFRMIYAFTENFVLPLSHDEVVHGKRSLLSQMPGDYWQQFANLRLLFGYQYAMPGKKLLFMGGEFGQWTEWNHDTELDWALFGHKYHDSLRRYVGDWNRLYKTLPALYANDFEADGFAWIQCDDWQNSVFAFERTDRGSEHTAIAICNFTPVPRENYRIGVSQQGFWQELLNSDAAIYGGTNMGNDGGIYSEPIESHGKQQSISITLPPLGMLLLAPR
ncbi:MAG: 1,4-alpha-glucan branching protein GlgB [Planctomycetaceae bacterium]|jgi:1,4-alpha-glucan branching enzyme|nr:1,4-alpha-glucan branching protein GlgB [Planctomycetaceae bacterium]MBT6488054.1 1,4-alpha-glucan branching protein GlgB [Planctomycetaceae bacterium]MBT6497472.1 1,4-alpha-glucan branching protein GlgB [Planctomycetaceae bacterium]